MDDRASDETARNRWMMIQAVRASGAVMAVIGILVVNQSIAILPLVGYVLIAAGIVEVFLVPTLLARRWRTPRE